MAINPDYLEEEDVQKFISVIKSERDKLLFRLIYATGMRISEALRFNISKDFNPKTFEMKVFGKGSKWRTVVPLTVKDRKIIPDKELMDEITTYCNRIETSIPFNVSSRWARKLTEQLGKKVGLPQAHPHIFRHSFAVRMTKNGMPLPFLQRLLGHSSLAITGVYQRFNITDILTYLNQ